MGFVNCLWQKICSFFRRDKQIFYIHGPEPLPDPLSSEEEEAAFLLLKTEPARAREILITRNLRLVVYIARKFESSGVCIEDLVGIGSVGLIKAVNTFCPEKKIKLATYASRCIENEILMHLRKISGRKNEYSIDEPLKVDYDGNELLLSDVLGTEEDEICKNVEQAAEYALLHRALETLSEREREIISLRFGLDGKEEQTQKEVADRVGISQSYISRLEKKIIRHLRKELSCLNGEG